MKHLTPYRLYESSLSPVWGEGMVYEDGLKNLYPKNAEGYGSE